MTNVSEHSVCVREGGGRYVFDRGMRAGIVSVRGTNTTRVYV